MALNFRCPGCERLLSRENKPEAMVCDWCGEPFDPNKALEETPPPRRLAFTWVWFTAGALLIVSVVAGLITYAVLPSATSADALQERTCILSGELGKILTKEKYDKIEPNMSLKDVYSILQMGSENESLGPKPESLSADKEYRIRWVDGTGRGLGVMLHGDKVISKSKTELELVGQ